MESRLLRRKLLKQQESLSFEQRLQRAFPGSEWVEEAPISEGIPPALTPPAVGPTAIAVIGGAKFDEASLVTWLRTLPRDSLLITLTPRFRQDGEPYANSFEGNLIKHARELGIRVDTVPLHEDLYGTYAKGAQIGEAIRLSGQIVLVGNGGNQDRVRAIAAGDWAVAKATIGGRPIIEIQKEK